MADGSGSDFVGFWRMGQREAKSIHVHLRSRIVSVVLQRAAGRFPHERQAAQALRVDHRGAFVGRPTRLSA